MTSAALHSTSEAAIATDQSPVSQQSKVVDIQKVRIFQSGMFWAWSVLAACLTLTTAAYYTVKSDSESVAANRIEFREAEIVEAIEQRMIAYTHTLQGGLGLFRASNRVDRSEWHTYVDTLDLDHLFPGIQGMGYSEWVRPEDRARYEAAIKAEGFPDFRIRPPGKRKLYSSIVFLEPFDRRNRQAFGYDMYSQETRRRAMDLARDSGRAAISGAVRLVQEISDDVQAGFLMYVPYYGHGSQPATVEGRRAANLGFIYSPFRMRNLMEGILGPGLPDVRLKIYDGEGVGANALMYDSDPKSLHASPVFEKIQALDIAQRQWTLQVSSLPGFEARMDTQKSYLILIAGLVTSFLVFGVLWSFSTTGRRAQSLAVEMTAAVEENSRKLTQSNEELEQFAYVASHDLKAPLRGIDHLATWIQDDLGEKLTGESKENMLLLRGRIKRLDTLLADLLNFSRAGRIEAPLERVNPVDFIAGIFDLLNTEGHFELVQDTDVASIAIKKTALEQVFMNLFSNAMKHHDRGRGRLTVTLSDQENFYEFVVADDGPGIPADLRERAFQMFQTLQPRDNVEGSGMGLAIIRKIIERQGGTISVGQGPDGRGAVFRFSWQKLEAGED